MKFKQIKEKDKGRGMQHCIVKVKALFLAFSGYAHKCFSSENKHGCYFLRLHTSSLLIAWNSSSHVPNLMVGMTVGPLCLEDL